jgi:predicted nucleotidyltransferase
MTRPVPPMSFARQPLDVVLGNAASVRVMRALLAHGGPIPVPRLALDTRVSQNGVRDALRVLEQAGAVEVLGFGRTRLFQTRGGNPLVAALGGLFAAEQARFDAILQHIVDAASLPQVIGVWLFGSVARAQDTIDSDFDVGVVIDALPSEADAIADIIRDRILEPARACGFSPSVVSMTPADVRRMKDERSPLWNDFLRDLRVLSGDSLRNVLARSRENKVTANHD